MKTASMDSTSGTILLSTLTLYIDTGQSLFNQIHVIKG